MKETRKIIRPGYFPALFLMLIAAAFVGCASPENRNVSSARSNSDANGNAADVATMKTPAIKSSRLEPIERPFAEEPEYIRPARGSDEASKAVTKENFDRVKIGMTRREVVEIFGDEGMQTSTMKINNRETTIFKWTVPDFSKYIDLHFENDKVIEKKQKGLL